MQAENRVVELLSHDLAAIQEPRVLMEKRHPRARHFRAWFLVRDETEHYRMLLRAEAYHLP